MATLPVMVRESAVAKSGWQRQYAFTQTPGGPPIDLTGLTWTLTVRVSEADETPGGLVSISSTASTSMGSIAVTPVSGIVLATLLPAATLLLGLSSNAYGLWSDPNTATQQLWVRGPFDTTLAALP